MKTRGEKISFLTAYDYPFALLQDRACIDMILVGDSLGMTVLGYNTTLPVTMEDMVAHAKAVSRAARNSFLVGDMPYMSYQVDTRDAIRNAGRFMAECGMDAVKLEGGRTQLRAISAIADAGIPVMGHIGMTPQFAAQFGGYKVQGKDAETAKRLIEDAREIEKAGAFAILLECVPNKVTKMVYENLGILVLGIGAGPDVDGQLLIMHDVVGLFEAFTPKFVRRYADLGAVAMDAFGKYHKEVKSGAFPAPEHFYHIDKEEFAKI
jgi:3-methyl-2-oxobutanoate hydroxymethyltransferase